MPHKNLLLDRLPREVYDRISPDLEKVVMTNSSPERRGDQGVVFPADLHDFDNHHDERWSHG